MKNILRKLAEKIKTYSMFNNFFFFFENCGVYEIMWKNTVEPDTPQMAV